MAEFAKRNRQADTLQLLGAIGRIERVVGQGLLPPVAEPDFGEAAALIADLRIDLERISGKGEERASGLAARIERAAGTIVQATESVQEAAWGLREAGANEGLCDLLDQRAAEISTAAALIDGTVQQIDKIADTIAMLDSSLRAVIGLKPVAPEIDPFSAPTQPGHGAGLRDLAAAAGFDDLEMVDVEDGALTRPAASFAAAGLLGGEPQIGSMLQRDTDIVFSEPIDGMMTGPVDTPLPLAAAETRPVGPPSSATRAVGGFSEAGLRDIDALPVDRKLAYFA
ncbi:hypothetical protein [Bosea sp. AAP35]|uniref:hypothetical protein n=1 Tax=Bosea sp. AAP35 TaxID=1523417 RepID=UPI0012E258AC|nr:hypothetical protein [Bosea sp. AAP35]